MAFLLYLRRDRVSALKAFLAIVFVSVVAAVGCELRLGGVEPEFMQWVAFLFLKAQAIKSKAPFLGIGGIGGSGSFDSAFGSWSRLRSLSSRHYHAL